MNHSSFADAFKNGAATLNITTLDMMTLKIMTHST